MEHRHNRRALTKDEERELDFTLGEYEAARAEARETLLAAQTAYRDAVMAATRRRDTRIAAVVDASSDRGTQARVAEYLDMNPTYLSTRIRMVRSRK